MEYIYLRVSTEKQHTENQSAKITAKYPTATIYEETASGVKERPVLADLLKNKLKSGDVLIVAELSRLGRRMSEVVRIIEELHERGVAVHSEREQINYSTPAGRMMTQVLASCAELEREMLRQRTREALAAKKAQGIVGGRRPTFSPETVAKVRELRAQGKTVREVAQETGVSPSRVSQLSRAG
jgi:DNA invertase Pin-like site-specific DNA recombinase